MKTIRLIVIGLLLLTAGIWFGRGYDSNTDNAGNDNEISRVYDIAVPLS